MPCPIEDDLATPEVNVGVGCEIGEAFALSELVLVADEVGGGEV